MTGSPNQPRTGTTLRRRMKHYPTTGVSTAVTWTSSRSTVTTIPRRARTRIQDMTPPSVLTKKGPQWSSEDDDAADLVLSTDVVDDLDDGKRSHTSSLACADAARSPSIRGSNNGASEVRPAGAWMCSVCNYPHLGTGSEHGASSPLWGQACGSLTAAGTARFA